MVIIVAVVYAGAHVHAQAALRLLFDLEGGRETESAD